MDRLRILGAAAALREFTVRRLAVFSGASEQAVVRFLTSEPELFEILHDGSTDQPTVGQSRRYNVREIDRIRAELRSLESPGPSWSPTELLPMTELDRQAAVVLAEDIVERAWAASTPSAQELLAQTALESLSQARWADGEHPPADKALARRADSVAVVANLALSHAQGRQLEADGLKQAAYALARLDEFAPERVRRLSRAMVDAVIISHQERASEVGVNILPKFRRGRSADNLDDLVDEFVAQLPAHAREFAGWTSATRPSSQLSGTMNRGGQGVDHKKYAAAVDQGTTGTRFMVFSHDGKVVSTDYLEHEQIYPKPGWVEHDPMEIWDKTQRVIKGSMQKGGIKADEISGIGVTNQRETTVVWEKKTGKPVYNAIVWQDTRTIDICQKLINDGVEPLVKSKTGLVVATYFSGPKIQWILDNVSGARAAAERGDLLFGNIDTWVIWWLTGGPDGGAHVTDYSNGSRTMLMDLKTLDWDAELLSKIKVPRAMLPQIRPSSDKKFYGQTKANGAVGGAVPVCADLGDQQAALFGQTCYSPGEAKNTYGTGNFMLLNTGASPVPSKSGLLTTAAYGLEQGKSVYALEGSIAITGAAIQWLRDNLGLIKDASETEAIAKSVDDAGGIYFVPAFSGLFAPHWDMYARGAIVGLTRYVNRAHIVRATLESICYQTKEVADAMERDSGVKLTTLKVDGGAVKNDFLMQLQADILGVDVIRPQVQETTSLGAAYGAGLATGFWTTLDELRKNWQVDKVFKPQWSDARRREGLAGWKKAVQRTLHWVEKEPAKDAVHAGAST